MKIRMYKYGKLYNVKYKFYRGPMWRFLRICLRQLVFILKILENLFFQISEKIFFSKFLFFLNLGWCQTKCPRIPTLILLWPKLVSETRAFYSKLSRAPKKEYKMTSLGGKRPKIFTNPAKIYAFWTTKVNIIEMVLEKICLLK